MTSSTPGPWPLLTDWPRTRFADWRTHSPIARFVDVFVALAGAALVGVSLFDAVGSFSHNHVFVYPEPLEHLAAAILLLGWPWIIVSAWMIAGVPRRGETRWRRRRIANWRGAAPWAGAFAAIVAVIVVGFVLGAAKGSLRVLPGGVHQVSTLDLNSAQWTTVSQADYQKWAAHFVREDAILSTFGLVMVGFVAVVRRLRQRLSSLGM